MTYKRYGVTAKRYGVTAPSVNLAIDDEALYRKLAALRTFEDCDELIRALHVSELVHYGEYPSSTVSQAMGRTATA
jgi:hypothetical protein